MKKCKGEASFCLARILGLNVAVASRRTALVAAVNGLFDGSTVRRFDGRKQWKILKSPLRSTSNHNSCRRRSEHRSVRSWLKDAKRAKKRERGRYL